MQHLEKNVKFLLHVLNIGATTIRAEPRINISVGSYLWGPKISHRNGSAVMWSYSLLALTNPRWGLWRLRNIIQYIMFGVTHLVLLYKDLFSQQFCFSRHLPREDFPMNERMFWFWLAMTQALKPKFTITQSAKLRTSTHLLNGASYLGMVLPQWAVALQADQPF